MCLYLEREEGKDKIEPEWVQTKAKGKFLLRCPKQRKKRSRSNPSRLEQRIKRPRSNPRDHRGASTLALACLVQVIPCLSFRLCVAFINLLLILKTAGLIVVVLAVFWPEGILSLLWFVLLVSHFSEYRLTHVQLLA